MKLSESELEFLRSNSLSIANARGLADFIESDSTVAGIFPNGNNNDFNNPDKEKFVNKWCSWWPIARVLLQIAKAFTGEKGDKVIDALVKLGDQICV